MVNKIKAFTLAEVMVTLTIMGVLASIMLPVLKDIQPDKTKATFKKAYYVTERIVYDMVTDEDLYPSLGAYRGFDNTNQAFYNGRSYGGGNNGRHKFYKLFAAHVNKTTTEPNSGAEIPENGIVGEPNIVTTDGIAWYIPESEFVDCNGLNGGEDPNHALGIMVDVNGARDPNTIGVDRFMIYIQADGRVFVNDGTDAGQKAASYLRSSNVQKD